MYLSKIVDNTGFKLLYALYLTVGCIGLMSCEEETQIDNTTDFEEKVYITGFIAPSLNTLSVNVNSAVSVTKASPTSFAIENATVTIANNQGQSTNLIYQTAQKAYQAPAAQLPIIAGQSYFLTVNINGEIFTASCKVPENQPQISGSAIREADELRVDAAIQDIANQNNYFIVGARIQGDDSELFDPIAFNSDGLVTDRNLDGQPISVKGELESIFLENFALDTKIILKVLNAEKDLFDYYKQIQIAQEEVDILNTPQVFPNNISGKGVIGIFAAYQEQSIELSF